MDEDQIAAVAIATRAAAEQIAEENLLIFHFSTALQVLTNQDRRWESNLRKFCGWSTDQRIKWIRYIERQAQTGLPMAEQLTAAALAARMMR